jgi:Asp-tRNA(Asn)/Glu-tRNA(Gln) amidotransferase A subunit family amidase
MLDVNAVGPMARHVEDLELLLPLLAGRDDVDPFVQGAQLEAPAPLARVGFYVDDRVARVSEATARTVEDAARVLADRGAVVEQVSPPDVSEATELFFALMAADGGARARQDLAPAGGRHVPQLRDLLANLEPLACDAPALFELVRRLYAFRARVRAFVGTYDVVLAPVTTGPAPPHGCTPGSEAPLESYDAFNYTHAYSLAGLPVAVVRAGAERGLPLGVQVVAPAFRDRTSLAAARLVEDALGGFVPAAPEPRTIVA